MKFDLVEGEIIQIDLSSTSSFSGCLMTVIRALDSGVLCSVRLPITGDEKDHKIGLYNAKWDEVRKTGGHIYDYCDLITLNHIFKPVRD